MQASRVNFYGQGGSGKTTLLLSSMMDIYSGELTDPTAVWIQVGQERNTALVVPDKNVRRFVVDPIQPHAVVTELVDFLKSLQVAAGKGRSPGKILFDGWTELDIVLGYAHDLQPLDDDKWSEWRYRKRILCKVTQLLDAQTLGCHVLSTARVAEQRKGVYSKKEGEVVGADPEFVTSRYFPQMDGWMRYNLPSYMDYCFYLEADDSPSGAVHRCYLVQTGDFFIKNQNSHKWKRLKELPAYLDDTNFTDIERTLEYATATVAS